MISEQDGFYIRQISLALRRLKIVVTHARCQIDLLKSSAATTLKPGLKEPVIGRGLAREGRVHLLFTHQTPQDELSVLDFQLTIAHSPTYLSNSLV